MLAALDRGAERVQGVRGGHSLDGGLARGWRGVGGGLEGLARGWRDRAGRYKVSAFLLNHSHCSASPW